MGVLTHLPGAVRLVEVGPRDGLQNEPRVVPTEDKVRFIEALAEAGHRHIEVASMVRPDLVPQLADGEEVLRRLQPRPEVVFTVLVPNERGLERALRAGARSIAVFTAASDTFSRKNTGASIEESLKKLEAVVRRARQENLRLRGYISTAVACPFEGKTAPEKTAALASRLRGLGIDNLSLGDTLGVADPLSIDRLLDAIEEKCPPPEGESSALSGLALHLHDTYKRALANALVGLERGIVEFDASAGGLGGCPFAPGASGNLDTALLVETLHAMGIETGIDLARHRRAVEIIRGPLTAARNLEPTNTRER
ncbi:MAG: hydroxymethylglutaryl-CoA lyase [Planctomycetes bacterium]|nr:hydroxymethylglutaryl-CoA lyase [Planctomycetota bacterium]